MAKDPYRYFRIEARELVQGLSEGARAIASGAQTPEEQVRLLRLAHTLKGAARVVKQNRIAELAHALESALAQSPGSGATPDANAVLSALDEVRGLLDELDGAGAATPDNPQKVTAQTQHATDRESLDTLRVDVAELETLLRGVAEASTKLSELRGELGTVERARHLAQVVRSNWERLSSAGAETDRPSPTRSALALVAAARNASEELDSTLEHLGRNTLARITELELELDQLREQSQRLRLLPVNTLFSALERAALDAAEVEGKQIELQTSGGENRADAHVLTELRDALFHVVRNAVAHGIEARAERSRLGKPPKGLVRLEVTRQGRALSLTCIDDGRGIDAESVRKAAVARGLIGPGEAAQLTREQVLRLVLRGGLTTATSVNEVSGRGVGLDVLRVTALRLRGKVAIESEPGHGTRLEVVVPLSLSATTVIVTDVGGSTVLIPLDAVDTMLRVSDKDITRSLGADAISYAGQAIPFVSVARALGRKGSRVNGPWSVAIVRCTAGTVAIAVDGLLGTANVVVRPLPELMDPMPWVTGVSLDAQGTPRLVIDPIALANSAGSEFGLVRRAARVNLPILVVDDSLTTRMLEQSILETAGYDVELATSAEEALVKAQNRRYLMFVVDVEMPGMNGFEFIQRTQSDPTLCEIPAVLVTSRNAPEDLERGRQVGAKGYIVKGEFDQGELLRTIARLTGTEAQE